MDIDTVQSKMTITLETFKKIKSLGAHPFAEYWRCDDSPIEVSSMAHWVKLAVDSAIMLGLLTGIDVSRSDAFAAFADGDYDLDDISMPFRYFLNGRFLREVGGC
jgi:hypothetical protein